MPIFAKMKLAVLLTKLILLLLGGFIGYKVIKKLKTEPKKEKANIYFEDGMRKPSLVDLGIPCHASTAESSILKNREPCKASLPVCSKDVRDVDSRTESQASKMPGKKEKEEVLFAPDLSCLSYLSLNSN